MAPGDLWKSNTDHNSTNAKKKTNPLKKIPRNQCPQLRAFGRTNALDFTKGTIAFTSSDGKVLDYIPKNEYSLAESPGENAL